MRRFQALAEGFYEESFARFPILGTEAGRHEFDSELGGAGPEIFERQAELVERTLRVVEDLPPQDFGAEEMLDRRTFLANLREERLHLSELRRQENNPQVHLHAAADAIHGLFVRHADNLAPVAGAILARLKQIPRYLDEGAGGLRRPDPLWKRLTMKAAPAVGEMFMTLAGPLAAAMGEMRSAERGVRKIRDAEGGKRKEQGADRRLEESIMRVARAAAEAAEEYARRVGGLRPAAAGSYAVGEERMAALIRERLGLDLAPREAVAAARRLAGELGEALRVEARRFHPRKKPAEILEAAAAEWAERECGTRNAERGKLGMRNAEHGKELNEREYETPDLVGAYRSTVETMRQRFTEADWVSFPGGDRLIVRAVPEFMKDLFPTAAYSSPGPFDPDQTGIFWVNDLGARAEDPARARAELAQHFGLELTCAHEAYPGHHLQFIRQNRHPSAARRMAHHAIYYEGWTLWCEQMVADLGVPENPYTRLAGLSDALWRAWRIVIDVGLQTGELSYDQACEVIQREVGFTRARAEGDVNWYTAAPSVPMSYLLGKVELMRLKRERVDRGAMSLREFNDWVLSFGAIPWRWIEQSGL